MNNKMFTTLVPLALVLSACTTTVRPAYQNTGTRLSPCIDGGPTRVAQAFYDRRAENHGQGLPDSTLLAQYRPYLSEKLYQSLQKASQDVQLRYRLQGDLFSGMAAGPVSADVMSTSSIPGNDARNIPLRVSMRRHSNKSDILWQDEVLMVKEGSCWVIDDVRYLADEPYLNGGSLSQVLEK